MTFDKRKQRESSPAGLPEVLRGVVELDFAWTQPPKGTAHIQTSSKVKNLICINTRVSGSGCSRCEM